MLRSMNSPSTDNLMEAWLCIPATHPALPGHFPGQPIVPGVLLLDEVREVVEARSGRRVQCVAQLKFMEALAPGERAWLQARIEGGQVTFHVTAARADETVTLARGSLLLADTEAA
jgi:3-hydroxymyristoyl/3-hydroxydecanoyl-(acyl carrier protein) dehydratase